MLHCTYRRNHVGGRFNTDEAETDGCESVMVERWIFLSLDFLLLARLRFWRGT